MFKLHVIQAQFGDSLLLEYGESVRHPKYILIDGGPKDVYKDSLRGELKRIVGEGGTLEAAMISHIDTDHIKGVLDLLVELKSQKDNGGADYFLTIKELWFNTFSGIIDTDDSLTQRMDTIFATAGVENVAMASTGFAINSVKEGDSVTRYCNYLDIPINSQAVGGFFKADPHQNDVAFSNLKFIITGPTEANLNQLKAKWEEWLDEQEEAISNGTFNILGMSDKSIPNLSSLTFLVEGDGRTILFTGDARGDHLIDGLQEKGLLTNGKLHVDVFKVAHHGSDRNTDEEFFETITADTYVISANGKDDNPDYPTLEWIVKAAKKARRKIKLVITNETPSTKKLLKNYDTTTYGYSVSYIPRGKFSIEV